MPLFDRLAFCIPAFSVTPVLTRANRVLEVARIFTKHSKCCDKFFVLTMSLYAFISLLYNHLLQYTLLKSFTVPSASLTKFLNKFHTKLLAPAFIFTKLSTKTLCFDAAGFHLSIKGYCKTRPHRSYCFLSMFKLHCKRHYRNLATYGWCTTWREHVTKTAPVRRQHAVGGGGAAAAARRRRRTALFKTACRDNVCQYRTQGRIKLSGAHAKICGVPIFRVDVDHGSKLDYVRRYVQS